MRLYTANAAAHAAACTHVIDGGQEFTDPSTSGGRDEGEFWRPCAKGKTAAQAIKRRLCTGSIRLVHGNDVGDLKDPRLHRLHLIAPLGSFYNEQHIGEPRNADLGLPSTNGLDKDQVKPCRLNQDRGRSGDMRKGATAATSGDGAREATIIVGMFVNAHAITEQCTTALVRARINRKDRNAATRGAGDIGECCGERTLPRPWCASQPHNKGVARVGRRCGERLLNALICCRSWTLDCADPLRQLAARREMLSVDGHSRAGR